MANNFSDAQVVIANNSLTDIVTASNKSMVIGGTLTNTHTAGINVTLKKYDASTTTDFVILSTVPLPTGAALEIPKIVLQTSDKVKAQSDHASGLLTVALNLLTDIT
tara:strand:+ start:436 stop:756 length:321 start_codon:yes stop_codon:yes gene_type:complete